MNEETTLPPDPPLAGFTRDGFPLTIGAYRIVERLGEGGMGAVYLAEQQHPRRTVALKVIKAGLGGAEFQRRFHLEADLLGRLQHPGIAQIYEAGTATTAFGPRPFFAMEYIQGEPLNRYVENRRLETRQRLALMADICDGVHHAHQRGIIHRDLKPANILVDTTGQPKILDFGVARVTESDLHATRHTDAGQLVGTVTYMSPEQVLADPSAIDIRSDVYALGVILYELLAGTLPCDLDRKPLHDAVRIIREEEPAPLSSISPTYRGDVETIVAKALEKNRERRYASAAELAADLRRHLRDLPIIARPPSLGYQLQKFARRHTALVAGVAAVFVVLVAGSVVSTWEAVRARRAESAAVIDRDRARQAEERTRVERDRATAAEQQATAERDKAVAAEATATVERDRAVAAEARAQQDRNRAVSEQQRADTESAAAKAVNAFLQDDLLAQASANTQARPDNKPDPDLKVRTALDRAAARIGRQFDRHPLVEASIRQTIGNTYKELGLFPEAQRQVERALELQRRAIGEEHAETLTTMNTLAELHTNQGQYAQAELLFAKALEIGRRVLGEEHSDILANTNNLAVLYRSQGKYGQAESLLTRVVEVRRRAFGEEHPGTLASMNNLASLYRDQGKEAQAEPLYVRVFEVARRVLGEEHPNTLTSMNNLAGSYMVQGKAAQAEPLYIKVLEVRRRVQGEEHPSTLISTYNLAALYMRQAKYGQAEPLYTKILEVGRRVQGEEHPDTLATMNSLGSVYQSQGDEARGESFFTRALEVQRRVLGADHPDTLATMTNLARLCGSQRRYGQAESLYTTVLDARRRVLRADHPNTLASMSNLAALYLDEGKYAPAESLLREALRGYDKTASNRWERYDSESLLGVSLSGQKNYAEAEPLLLSGYEGMTRRFAAIPAASRSAVERAAVGLVQLYQDWGKPEKAAEWHETLKKTDSRPVKE